MPRRANPADTSVTPSVARDEQFYYPGSFNWQFLRRYPDAARLFNAFDYGHATLYEHLYATPAAQLTAALDREFAFLTRDLLVHPPRLGVPEQAIEPAYARIAWGAKVMFDWAHVLHRQIYDVYADPSLPPATKDSLVEVLTDYYLSRRDAAFTPVPKSMALMDGQPFSGTFRREQARFNGLIWAYHWLQVGLYEPFLASNDPATQSAGVAAAVAHFREMLVDPPAHMPRTMPMTPGVAPEFSRRHPRAAIIFDNLHMMHDIISDILLSPLVPADQKARVIAEQLSEFRNPARNVTSVEEWREMGEMMGGEVPESHHH